MKLTAVRFLPFVLLLAACSAPPSQPEALVIGTSSLGGELHVARFEVKAGMTASFDRDLIVDSDDEILILGVLRGEAGDPAKADPRGADLVLRSKTRIVIAGEILGAPGRDGSLNPEALALLGEDPRATKLDREQAGLALRMLLAGHPDAITDARIFDAGRGGHVILEAPEIVIERVEAGRGGVGGPGGNGGAGGTFYTDRGVSFREFSPGGRGGEAGLGGMGVHGVREGRGGAGGAGGGAGLWPPPIARS